MNVLGLVQEFCAKKTLPVPSAVVASTDTAVIQIFNLLKEEIRELGLKAWQEQKIQKTFTSIAAEDQGALSTVIGADFISIQPGTFWDQTLKRPVFGPVGDISWSNLKAFPASGPIYQYKVFANHLYIFPAPPAGHTMYLIYQTKYPVASSAGTAKETVTVDTDIFLVPDYVVTRGLDYRWKRAVGEPWEVDYAEYNALKASAMVTTGRPVLHLDGQKLKLTPGIWVPAGDWPH